MSEHDDLRCQCKQPGYFEVACGKPAVYRYRALNWLPHLLCSECALRFGAVPWMRKRLERLDAGEGGS